MSGVESDYEEYLADKRESDIRSHELAMRGTRVKVAKIEARAKVREAKARNPDYILLRGFVALFALFAVLIVCVTYWAVQPSDPNEQRIKQERYETCMQVEEDYEKCDLAGS